MSQKCRISAQGLFSKQPPERTEAMEQAMKMNLMQKREQQAEKRRRLGLPRYTLGEEIFSSVSHGVSALLAVAGLVLPLVFRAKTPLKVASLSSYRATTVPVSTVATL